MAQSVPHLRLLQWKGHSTTIHAVVLHFNAPARGDPLQISNALARGDPLQISRQTLPLQKLEGLSYQRLNTTLDRILERDGMTDGQNCCS